MYFVVFLTCTVWQLHYYIDKIVRDMYKATQMLINKKDTLSKNKTKQKTSCTVKPFY